MTTSLTIEISQTVTVSPVATDAIVIQENARPILPKTRMLFLGVATTGALLISGGMCTQIIPPTLTPSVMFYTNAARHAIDLTNDFSPFSQSAVMTGVISGYNDVEGSVEEEMTEPEWERLQSMISLSTKHIDVEVKRIDEKINGLEKSLESKITGLEKSLTQAIESQTKALQSSIDGIKGTQQTNDNRSFVWRQTLVVGVVVALVTFLANYALKWLPQPPTH